MKTLRLSLAVMAAGGGIAAMALAKAPPEARIEFSTWGMPGEERSVVVLAADNSLKVSHEGLPITPQGPTVRSKLLHLSAPEADALVAMAAEADDFGAECRTVADGTSARLKVVVAGKAVVRSCDMAQVWPSGPKTRRFLERLNTLLPADLNVHR